MTTNHTITLSTVDIFQIIDALNLRADSYKHTARYLSGKATENENLPLEECNDQFEAQEIAKHFGNITETIESQL